MPWYFPTTSEALKEGMGDCQGRALVLASILAAKHIPYSLHMSFDHIWVDYPGHQATALENSGVEIAGQRNGHWFFHWPAYIDLRAEINAQVAQYWTPAPIVRRALLFGGLAGIVLWNALAALPAGRALSARTMPGVELDGALAGAGAGAAYGPTAPAPRRRLGHPAFTGVASGWRRRRHACGVALRKAARIVCCRPSRA